MGKTELTKNSAIVFTATFVSSLCTFLFQVMMGRAMTLDHFGQFNALLSVQLIFSVLAGALILLYTRHVARLWIQHEVGLLRWLYLHAWKVLAAAGLVCAVLIVATSALWRPWLNIDSTAMVVMAALLIATYFLQSVPLSFVRGVQKFYLFGIGLTSSGILKLLLGAFFIAIGITVANALLSLILAVTLSIVIMHYMLWPLFRDGTPSAMPMDHAENIRYCLKAMAGTFFPIFFVNVDMILVRSLFAPDVSGHYAAFTVIGKIIYLSGTVVAIALFPATVSVDAMKRGRNNELIYRAMLLLLLAGGAIFVAVWLYPAEILRALFGIDDLQTAHLLPYYCASMLAVSLILVEAHYRLAMGQYRFLWAAAVAAVLQAIGIVVLSSSLANIVMFQAGLFWAVFILRLVSVVTEHHPAVERSATS